MCRCRVEASRCRWAGAHFPSARTSSAVAGVLGPAESERPNREHTHIELTQSKGPRYLNIEYYIWLLH